MNRDGQLWRDTWTPVTLTRLDEARENIDLSDDGTDPGGRRYVGLGRCRWHGNVWMVEMSKAPICEWCALDDDLTTERRGKHETRH